MDPFSLATGVVGLVGFALHLVVGALGLIDKTVAAHNEIADELKELKEDLQHLQMRMVHIHRTLKVWASDTKDRGFKMLLREEDSQAAVAELRTALEETFNIFQRLTDQTKTKESTLRSLPDDIKSLAFLRVVLKHNLAPSKSTNLLKSLRDIRSEIQTRLRKLDTTFQHTWELYTTMTNRLMRVSVLSTSTTLTARIQLLSWLEKIWGFSRQRKDAMVIEQVVSGDQVEPNTLNREEEEEEVRASGSRSMGFDKLSLPSLERAPRVKHPPSQPAAESDNESYLPQLPPFRPLSLARPPGSIVVPQPPPFRPRFLARPPGSIFVPSFGQRAPPPPARNSNAGGLQLRLQASPHLLSPSIPPSPVQPWSRENDELSSPPHSLWTVDPPNIPRTSRPTTLWVVGELQDYLERQARTPGPDQMPDFSFDLTPPARFATLPTLDEDRDEVASFTIHTHTSTNSLTSVSGRLPRAPPPLPAVENGGWLSLASEVDSSVLDTPLSPVTSLVPPSSTASSSSATFRQQLEDKFPAPPPTQPVAESDDESYRVPSPARTATPPPPPLPPKPQPQLKPPQSLPRRRSEDSFRAIPIREADLEAAIRLAKAREGAKQSTWVALEDSSDEDSAYSEDEFSEQESDAQVMIPPPSQRRHPPGVSKPQQRNIVKKHRSRKSSITFRHRSAEVLRRRRALHASAVPPLRSSKTASSIPAMPTLATS